MTFRTAVAHASALTRMAVEDVITADRRFTHVGDARSLGETYDLIDAVRPDLLLMEFEQVRGLGATGLGEVVAELGLRVVMYGPITDSTVVVEALGMGAVGIVHYSCEPDALLLGLADVMRGRTFLFLGESRVPPDTRIVDACDLTPRQREVLQLLLMRRSNEEIAESLTVSRQTVKNYASQVFRKMGVANRGELHRAHSEQGLPPRLSDGMQARAV